MKVWTKILPLLMSGFATALAHGQSLLPPNNPEAIVNLATPQGAKLLSATWRYRDADVVEVEHRSPGPDLKPSGPPNRTHDIHPHAGAADFDDRSWEVIEPDSLSTRRSTGRLSFAWYRMQLTIPAKIGEFDTRGSTAIFEIVVDDYAEIWVDGRQPQTIGQVGGPMAAGWNSPNRLALGRNLQPGQIIQLAVFAANGPLSNPPPNFIWVRSATVEFYRPERLSSARTVSFELDRRDPQLDAVVPPGTVLEKLADGFTFTEGPVWVPAGIGGAGGKPIDEGYSSPQKICNITAGNDR